MILHSNICAQVDLQPNARGIWVILFNRLQSATKTARYVHGVLVAMCVFIVRYGASTFVTQLESVQAGMFSMVLEKVNGTFSGAC
jgi:exportin-2 (importin alpha re-exporter)